jgi:subtilisin-like proprotein convertase family protein
VRILRCSLALAACAFVLRVAAFAQAAPWIFSYEGDFHLPIPAVSGAGGGWMDDAVLDIPNHAVIADLDVMITVTHTLAFDLQVFLQSPSGYRVLLNRYDPLTSYLPGANYDHTVFDDEAATAIQEGLPPFAERFRPLERLSAFDGEDAYGPWRLQIYDAFYYNTGWLDQFGLSITGTPVAPTPAALTLALITLGLIRPARRRITGAKPAEGRHRNG